MALVNCPDCGKQISPSAAACPNCGRPFYEVKKGLSGCTLLAVIVAAIITAAILLYVLHHINTEADKYIREANISTR